MELTFQITINQLLWKVWGQLRIALFLILLMLKGNSVVDVNGYVVERDYSGLQTLFHPALQGFPKTRRGFSLPYNLPLPPTVVAMGVCVYQCPLLIWGCEGLTSSFPPTGHTVWRKKDSTSLLLSPTNLGQLKGRITWPAYQLLRQGWWGMRSWGGG